MKMHVPGQCQGQIVEYSYGWHEGILYQRVYDRSDRTESWYRASDEDSALVDENVWDREPKVSVWIPCGDPEA